MIWQKPNHADLKALYNKYRTNIKEPQLAWMSREVLTVHCFCSVAKYNHAEIEGTGNLSDNSTNYQAFDCRVIVVCTTGKWTAPKSYEQI